jgi:hypothetical protein
MKNNGPAGLSARTPKFMTADDLFNRVKNMNDLKKVRTLLKAAGKFNTSVVGELANKLEDRAGLFDFKSDRVDTINTIRIFRDEHQKQNGY